MANGGERIDEGEDGKLPQEKGRLSKAEIEFDLSTLDALSAARERLANHEAERQAVAKHLKIKRIEDHA
jgi:hypothetical protein